jgi:two-component system, LuxR family, response regulator FixJ
MAIERLVHIVDADAERCQVLKRLLCSAGLNAIVYPTPCTVLAAAPALRSGCVLLDLATPGTDGSTLQMQLRALGVCLPVIATAPKGDVTTAVEAMKAGAVDFIERPIDDRRLLAAIEAALADPRTEPAPGAAARRRGVLSNRERQVLDAIVAGHPNKVIAHHLGISMRTVEVHRAHMLERLGMRSIAEAISLAALARLATPAESDQGSF